MITSLYANNYRSMVNFRVEFGTVSLLMGKNGTGKSTVFRLLLMLRNFMGGALRAGDAFPASSLTRWISSPMQVFELGVKSDNCEYDYYLEIKHDVQNKICQVVSESVKCNDRVVFDRNDSFAKWYDDSYTIGQSLMMDPTLSGISMVFDNQKYSTLYQFKKIFDKILFFDPNPKKMSGRYEQDIAVPNVEMTDIVSVYATLQQTQMKSVFELQEQMKRIEPAFEEAKMKFSMNGKMLEMTYKYMDTGCSMDFLELSEGERMRFSLYLILIAYIKKGYSVFIDEPDSYLSLREIQPWCREVEDACLLGGQCILISHNAEVIDYFAGDCGIWMNRLVSGEAVVEKDPYAKWQGEDFLKYSELIAGGYMDEI